MGSIESGSRFCNFLQNIVRGMSSSSVHVREIRNDRGEDILHFTIDTNGIDIQPQMDGELPKDHTYTKEPATDEDFGPSDEKVESANVSSPKKTGRSSRNVKHKLLTSCILEKSKSPAKKEPVKKNARKQPLPKSNPKTDPEPEPFSNKDGSDKKLAVDEESVESPTKINKGRKRKIESKEEIPAAKILREESPEKNDAVSEKEQETPEKQDKKLPEKQDKKSPDKKSPEKDVSSGTRRGRSKTSAAPIPSNSPPKKESKPSPTKVKPPKKAKEAPPQKTPPTKSKGAASKKDEEAQFHMPALPKGWTRKVVERKSGKTAGAFDIYIFSPDGVKLRSKPDIAAYLANIKSDLKLEDFNFTKKGLTSPLKDPGKSNAKKISKKAVDGSSKKYVVKIPGPNKKTSPDAQEEKSTSTGRQKRRARV